MLGRMGGESRGCGEDGQEGRDASSAGREREGSISTLIRDGLWSGATKDDCHDSALK